MVRNGTRKLQSNVDNHFERSAIDVAVKALFKVWICRFDVSEKLHSDQGRNFESTLFLNVCRILNIHKTRPTALHPLSDGIEERTNRPINRFLYKVLYNVSDHQRDSNKFLHLFLCTPGGDVAGEVYISILRQRMDDIHERVCSSIQGSSDRTKRRPMTSTPSTGVYRVQKLPREKPRLVHFNRLTPFTASNGEQAEARVRYVSPSDSGTSFDEFMLLQNSQNARDGSFSGLLESKYRYAVIILLNKKTVDCFFYRTSRCKNGHVAGIVTDQKMTLQPRQEKVGRQRAEREKTAKYENLVFEPKHLWRLEKICVEIFALVIYAERVMPTRFADNIGALGLPHNITYKKWSEGNIVSVKETAEEVLKNIGEDPYLIV
ncbi:hypothetical protein NQ318_007733 [Aromia moschata]|uniref:Integrase catalytic domain-containing protein n=1 Tax=Aromia moschata TaxID=1265417 RepID=A0AAV8Z0Z2_9CUCU|nr:hypothetical protein NQ318_007733 [Aromia moschata]